VLFGIWYQYLRNRLSTHAGGSNSTKYWCLSTKLHSITKQMSVIFTVTASYLKMQRSCDYVSLGRLFLTTERILVPSKRELLAHHHIVTCLKTCIFSKNAVRISNLVHRELVGF